MGDSEGIFYKELSKRKSGEAFHLLLNSPCGEARSPPKLVTPKKEVSLEDIQTKIQLAGERRKAKQQAILDNAKAEEEKLLQAKIKRTQANDSFSAMAEENLKNKMSAYEENHNMVLNSKIDKYRTRNLNTVETIEKNKKAWSEIIEQRNNNLKMKLTKSAQLREEVIQQKKGKFQAWEDKVQQIRQRKQGEMKNENL